ncbi:serine endopeptidase, partial [Streptosporangium nondiastaticum]
TQDDELVRRTQMLDTLKARERSAEKAVENLHQKQTDIYQREAKLQQQIGVLEEAARKKLDEAYQDQVMRVFVYRLLLTLPLLALAAWLFAKKRKSQYWPFVWGFIIFAVMAFFVELVPYLPDYGG